MNSETLINQVKSVKDLKIQPVGNISIDQVYLKNLKTNIDGRGDLTELWSQPWSDKEPIASEIKHVYFNTTHEGIIKAWHAHELTQSQYTCVVGKMQVVLVDIRTNSKTFNQVNQLIIGTQNPTLIVIPPGVIKGWKSLHGDSVIVNLLTTADIFDNYRIPWDSMLTQIWEPHLG